MYCSKEEPKGADCLEAFQAMQDCMKDFPELYEKENEGVGERETNTDSDDKLKEQDIQSESNDNVPKPSNASDAEILTEQTRTNENISDNPPVSSLSLNDTQQAISEQALASNQISSLTETEKENTTQITDANSNIQVQIVESISITKDEEKAVTAES